MEEKMEDDEYDSRRWKMMSMTQEDGR